MDRIVTIGTSQGGVEALYGLISGLPADFRAPILVVLHIGAGQSALPSILAEIDGLKGFAHSGERIKAGHTSMSHRLTATCCFATDISN